MRAIRNSENAVAIALIFPTRGDKASPTPSITALKNLVSCKASTRATSQSLIAKIVSDKGFLNSSENAKPKSLIEADKSKTLPFTLFLNA